MKLNPPQAEFLTRLGYAFKDPGLLLEALTHPSLGTPGRRDNQRLEFLGDRVLGLVIAEALLKRDPDASEGQLAPRLNALVRKETCADVASDIDLGAALILGRSEAATGGRRKKAILGDAMEALLAAVYLDAGMAGARALILRLWDARLDQSETHKRDAKTALQEWAQARGHPLPEYREISRTGPDHAPMFTILVALATGDSAEARARSKRDAQMAAAEMLLERLEAQHG